LTPKRIQKAREPEPCVIPIEKGEKVEIVKFTVYTIG
jgi:hypothetical protein